MQKKEVERYENEDEEEEDRVGNGTDDSDWESSEDEGRKQRRRRAVDDGDRQEYLDRLSEWHEGRESGLADTRFERLEGGLQVGKLLNGLRFKMSLIW